jgi:hypothetical protein
MATYFFASVYGVRRIDAPGYFFGVNVLNVRVKSFEVLGADDPNWDPANGPSLPGARVGYLNAEPGSGGTTSLAFYWDGPPDTYPNGRYNVLVKIVWENANGEVVDYGNLATELASQVVVPDEPDPDPEPEPAPSRRRVMTRTWLA